jgi:hypothetical protein
MEDLNAQQIVLLTLLVSFVTSIATGITTVSLLEQAPDPVTQTINRVVEKTVERVVEVEGDQPVERVVETVVVNAEDLTKEAVAKNSQNLVRIYTKSGDVKNFSTLGIVVSANGDILADSRSVTSGIGYVADFPAGERNLEIKYLDDTNPFSLLTVTNPDDGSAPETFSFAEFADSGTVQLAQSVILISGQTNNIVDTGIITSLEDTSNNGSVDLIDTSIDGNKVLRGAMLLNLNGSIIGAKINGDPNRITAFITSNEIKEFLNFVSSQPQSAE